MAACALLAAGVGACGGGSAKDESRGRVEAYVHHVNAVEHRYAPAFKRANAAYVAFAKGRLAPAGAAARLTSAQREVAAARRDVAAITAPKEARTLRTRLLRYLRLNVGFARQTAWLAEYQRRSPKAVAALNAANRRLRRGLKSTVDTEQAAALDHFATALGHTVKDLQGLDVPAILRPAHDQQVRRLRTTRSLARRLRAAVLARDSQEVARLLLRFRRSATPAASGPGSARAIDQYNRRFRRLTRAYADVRREQARLDRATG